MGKIIDVHTHHMIPEYYKALVDNDALEEDGFPIPKPEEWSIEKHIEFMDRADVRWSLSYISSPQPHFGDDEACISLMRLINERLAAYKLQYPKRFGFAAHLPLPVIDNSIEEAIYCLDVLGADAVRMGSNLRGIYLGDKQTEPLFEELNKRNAIVVIHPQVPSPVNKDVWTGGPIPIYEFIADTTRGVLNYIANGFSEKFPNVRLVVPHNGSFLPNIAARFVNIMGTLIRFERMEYMDVEGAIKSLYFDTAGSPCPNLDFLMEIADPTHVLFGSDYPFKRMDNALFSVNYTRGYIDGNPKLRPYSDMILCDNAATLFGIDIDDT